MPDDASFLVRVSARAKIDLMAIGDDIQPFTVGNELFYGTGEDIALYIMFINLPTDLGARYNQEHFRREVVKNGVASPDHITTGFYSAFYRGAKGNGFRSYDGQINTSGKNSGYAINTYNEFFGDRDTSIFDTRHVDSEQNYRVRQSQVSTNYSNNVKAEGFAKELVKDPKHSYTKINSSSPSLPKFGPRTTAGRVANLAIRRACKFGLEYFTQQNGVVHYCLDRIDNDKAAKGEGIALSSYDKFSICNSELRFLFRNWMTFDRKRIGVVYGVNYQPGRPQVRFYRAFKEVEPLWEDPQYLDAWVSYAHHLVEKMLLKIQRGLQQQESLNTIPGQMLIPVLEQALKLDGVAAIQSFHAFNYPLIHKSLSHIQVPDAKRHAAFKGIA